MKYSVGDLVYKHGERDTIFEVIATKLDKRNILVSDGADYVIRKQGDNQHDFAFEEDIYLIYG